MQLIDALHGEDRTGRADGMAERDRSAVHVSKRAQLFQTLRAIGAQNLCAYKRRCREGFEFFKSLRQRKVDLAASRSVASTAAPAGA